MMPRGPTDRELVQRSKQDDRNAFRLLVERYQRKAFSVAVGLLSNPEDARDACQEAFVRAYRQLGGFEETAAFYTWLYRIVVHASIDELRKRRRGQTPLDESIPSDEPGPGDRVAVRELGKHVADAL